MNKVIIILSFLLAGSNLDANAGEKYKLEVDKFTDIKHPHTKQFQIKNVS